MAFNSLTFIIFFLIVYGLYLALNHRWQNRMLLAASYIFYGSWNWRFLWLLLFSTGLAYFCGAKINAACDPKIRKRFLLLCIAGNLLVLGVFKYANFFIANFQDLMAFLGARTDPVHLNIILPLGISFFTFQGLGYVIDIYRKNIKPASNFFDFALFKSFFPQLVAGPIERAKNLLPQILSPRVVTGEKVLEGCYLILWGYFLKIFAADNLAKIANGIFGNAAPYNGIEVLLGAYAFTWQVYCDFAGYSNIARGLGKLMGIELLNNFNLPFFVTNIQEFWKRWHISLTTWCQDYLYYPLFHALRRIKGNGRIYLSAFLTMTIIGFWHGARWNFVVFGAYHGLLMVIYFYTHARWDKMVQTKNQTLKTLWFWAGVMFLFHCAALGKLFFRAQTLAQIGELLKGLFLNFHLSDQFTLFQFLKIFVQLAWAVWPVILLEYIQFKKRDLFAVLRLHWAAQGLIYFLLIFLLLTFGVGGGREFIYFQF